MVVISAKIRVSHRPETYRSKELPSSFFVSLDAMVIFLGGKKPTAMAFHTQNGCIWCTALNGNGQSSIAPDVWCQWVKDLPVVPCPLDREEAVLITPEVIEQAQSYLANFGRIAKETDLGRKIAFDPIVTTK
jgi:hypothetical protein